MVMPGEMVLPPFLSCEALIKKSENFWYIELDIFQVEIFLIVLLHFKQIVKLEVKLQKTTIPPYMN